jgi:hypothetical protein
VARSVVARLTAGLLAFGTTGSAYRRAIPPTSSAFWSSRSPRTSSDAGGFRRSIQGTRPSASSVGRSHTHSFIFAAVSPCPHRPPRGSGKFTERALRHLKPLEPHSRRGAARPTVVLERIRRAAPVARCKAEEVDGNSPGLPLPVAVRRRVEHLIQDDQGQHEDHDRFAHLNSFRAMQVFLIVAPP